VEMFSQDAPTQKSSAINRRYQELDDHGGAAPSAPAASASVAAAESAVL
jgi:hypothetical protein